MADLGADGIDEVMRLADTFVEVGRRPIPKVPALRGKTIVSTFFEDSTRTRLSFETAAKRLSADVMTFTGSSSSLNKGESLRDTVLTIEAMGADCFVVRHACAGVPAQVAGWLAEVGSASVVNAGDGAHEHPTQALLDCFTISRERERRFGHRPRRPQVLSGLNVAIVGDIRHSRVARSDVIAFSALGANVTLVAPPTLLPPSLAGWPVEVSQDIDTVVAKSDVVYLLRLQNERMTEQFLPTLREYTATYGLTAERARLLSPSALVMHPGPMRRGIEIAAEVADSSVSVITAQVASGVAVRMAVLYLLVGSGARLARERQVLLRGGTVVDATGTRRADVLVKGEVVADVGPKLGSSPAGAIVLDAGGCVVAPGLVDLHTHLREPGAEESETIETGARAAALGGYTAVVAMPNTEPAADSAAVISHVLDLAKGACCDVRPAGTITVGRQGKALAPMAEMAALGVRIFTDDGAGVESAALMRRALEYAAGLGVVVADHCEEASLVGNGCINEGEMSSRLGLPGRPAVAEEVMVERDLALARLTGARLHLLHLSCAQSVAAVRLAKAAGVAVTAEVTPHHLVLTEEALASYDPMAKVNPPLRTLSDVMALIAGTADGTLDAIATDHAPHPPEAKQVAFCDAAPGLVGLETALGLVLGEAGLPLERLLALMSWQPAAIAGLSSNHGGPVLPGAPANLCVIDPERRWVVETAALASRSRNTPFAGRELKGKARHTVLAGEPVVIGEEAQR